MSERKFLKMHGLGNDFVIIDGRENPFKATADQTRFLADRRLGVGCDQVIVLERSEKANIFMRIFNSDGSQAEACGNATRCVAAILHFEKTGPYSTDNAFAAALNKAGFKPDSNLPSASPPLLHIETVAGVLDIQRTNQGEYCVNMGTPIVEDLQRHVDHAPGLAVILDIGNPHCVFVDVDLESVDIETVGPIVENDHQFPNRTNVHFVRIESSNSIRQHVWERGAGRTRASGSGACAGAIAAVRLGKAKFPVKVQMDGGPLEINEAPNGSITMQGPHSISFTGSFDEKKILGL